MQATILLVDDEQDAREPIRLVLENKYKVLCASSGAEALRILEKEEIHLLVADQRMPQMTGVELLTRVREIDPRIVRLILTAYTDFDAMLKAINEGQVYRYIIKPWDVNDMELTIRQGLEWRELFISKERLAEQLSRVNEALVRQTHALEQAFACRESLVSVVRVASVGLDQIATQLHEIQDLGDCMSDQSVEIVEHLAQLKQKTTALLDITSDMRNQVQQTTIPPKPLPIEPTR